MAQFDPLILLTLTVSFLVVWVFYYRFNAELLLPLFFCVSKLREKKASLYNSYISMSFSKSF